MMTSNLRSIFYFNKSTGHYQTLWNKRIDIETLKSSSQDDIEYHYITTEMQRNKLLKQHTAEFKKSNNITTPNLGF